MISRNPNPGDKIREYEIIETIGKGGMATVYRARHTMINQIVAIKIMKPSLMDDQQFCERFVREAQAQAQLSGHPNIVAIHNLFEEDNLYIIVMEYLDGMLVGNRRIRTLSQYIEYCGRLNVEQFTPILEGVLSGLGFAHEHHVVHRDIKPNNIMLTKNIQAKIVDFGIARIIEDQRLTKTGIAIGTPKYMSPEQVRSHSIDERSDVYSLGITMFEALTGKAPFRGDTDYEIMRHHEDTPPPLPRSIVPNIPRKWEDMILMCVAKDPEQRPQKVKEIQNILTGETKPKRPPVLHQREKPARAPMKSHSTVSSGKPFTPFARIFGAGVILLSLLAVYVFAIYLPGRRTAEPVVLPDVMPGDTLPSDILLEKYHNIGNIITQSSYVISAFIMCNENKLNEIIVQLLHEDTNLVYVHFTDNEYRVVASSDTSAIGAEYRSDFSSAANNIVRRRSNFYEGAFTVNAETNTLGALFFSARVPPDQNDQTPATLQRQHYSSIGNLLARYPEVEEAVIDKDTNTLNEIIMIVQHELPHIDYLHIVDQENIIIASSDTHMLNTEFNKPLIHTTLQDSADAYVGEFNIAVGNIQIGTLLLEAKLDR